MFLYAANELAETYLVSLLEIWKKTDSEKAKSLVHTIMFKKIYKISDATNKEFGEGQIVNMMDNDVPMAGMLFAMF